MEKKAEKYGRLVKIIQTVSVVFMLVMVVACIIFIIKNDINVKNIDTIVHHFECGPFTVALFIIIFNIVKAFALVFPPTLVYLATALVFENFWVALFVNFIATVLNLVLPYFLGRFLGKDLLHSLEDKYKTIKKLDNFTDENAFTVIFLFKAGGLLPSDLSSLVFGAQNIPFGKYFISSNLGMLALNLMWTLIGADGDLTDPLTYLYALPALIFTLWGTLYVGKSRDNKPKHSKKETEAE